MTRFLRPLLILIGFMLLSTTTFAETPFPTIHLPSDKSLKCIQPLDEMRRNHMNYILHERDVTVHEGVRNEPGNLAACIDCHVEPNEKGEIAGFDSKEHFCTTCHEYTSVQIDCFQCHADRPQKYINRAKHTSLIQQQLKETLTHKTTSDSDIGVNK